MKQDPKADVNKIAEEVKKSMNMPKKKKIKHLIIFNDMDVEVKTAIINNDKSTDLKFNIKIISTF